MTAKLAGFKLETELLPVLGTGFGVGEELVLAADVGQRVGAGFPFRVVPKVWYGLGVVLLEFTLMLGVETETEADCTCGLLQVLTAALEMASDSVTAVAGVATGTVRSGLWAAE